MKIGSKPMCRGKNQLISQLNSTFPISNCDSKLKFVVDSYSQTDKLLKTVNQISFQRDLNPTKAHKDLSQN